LDTSPKGSSIGPSSTIVSFFIFQKVVDFLIANDVDITVKDKTGRTAQDIAKHFGKNVSFQTKLELKKQDEEKKKQEEKKQEEEKKKQEEKKQEEEKMKQEEKKQEEEKKRFLSFILLPFEFFKKLNLTSKETEELFQNLKKMYLKYQKNGYTNEFVDKHILDQHEEKKEISTFRVNYETAFLSDVKEFKTKLKLSKDLKNEIRDMFDEKELNLSNVDEPTLYNLIYKDLFTLWTKKKLNSKIMQELDNMVNFQEKIKQDFDSFLLIRLKTVENIARCFPEMDEFIAVTESYFASTRTDVKMFFEMKIMEKEMKKMEKRVNQLEQLIEYLTNRNTDIPHDAVFIGSE
jgi:hypothetical protein